MNDEMFEVSRDDAELYLKLLYIVVEKNPPGVRRRTEPALLRTHDLSKRIELFQEALTCPGDQP